MYSIQIICSVVHGQYKQQWADVTIAHLVYDSRKIQLAESSLFFALKTSQNDGHLYLTDAYKKGIRNFIISEEGNAFQFPESNIILVHNTLTALQQLAAFHRSHFSIPVIGITGSNGKTVVKEWLYQLLEPDYHIVRSPKSYNSQIGVPLSVWQMNAQHTLAIFEAGISQAGEMQALAHIIQPTIGLITNVGEAHSEGFKNIYQKGAEKAKLVRNADIVIYCFEAIQPYFPFFNTSENFLSVHTKVLDWSAAMPAAVILRHTEKQDEKTELTLLYHQQTYSFTIPFTDEASIQNAVHCFCVMIYLGYEEEIIRERFPLLHSVDMRLQLKKGINDCTIINDSYSADITSLNAALNFLQQQTPTQKRTVILSDFFESGKTDEELYSEIGAAILRHGVQKVIAVGEKITAFLANHLLSPVDLISYPNTESFIQQFRSSTFKDETILIKGARRFGFERIVQLFDVKVHQTVLEINLNAIAHNLKAYQKLLQPGTRVMAMVKAFAYGSGGAEIAGVLQYHNTDYLGVAYADEGVELRKSGITLPIMVMNADASSFDALMDYNLQPVIYSFQLLQSFEQYISRQGMQSYPVHIEIETGMNRLGFALDDIKKLGAHLSASSFLKVESVFSHLAASEDPAQDAFTQQQAARFETAVHQLKEYVAYPFLQHIANSAAIVRHPQLQMDMVRLGIGLYGVESDNLKELDLQTVATLRSNIAQLKFLKKEETVSYNRRGLLKRDSVIATVRIGYADGYSRRFSNGTGKMRVNGRLAPVIGSVCMDMTMIDVTDVTGVKEGDEVIVFGAPLPVQQLARWIHTIPYEIMTGISQRVKRIYFQE